MTLHICFTVVGRDLCDVADRDRFPYRRPWVYSINSHDERLVRSLGRVKGHREKNMSIVSTYSLEPFHQYAAHRAQSTTYTCAAWFGKSFLP